MVDPGPDRDESRADRIADQPHGFPRSSQAGFHFGTDGHPFHVPAQDIGEKVIPFVASIEADRLSKQTAADPEADRLERDRESV
jgi:hypothetical protein